MSTIDYFFIFIISILVIILLITIYERQNALMEFCVSNGFQTYQNERCFKSTEDNKLVSKKIVCLDGITFISPTTCGWKIQEETK